MDDEKRISGLLEMATQRMKRFRELEEIEWKINFSIWGSLGAVAYLWMNSKNAVVLGLPKGRSVLLLVLIPVAIHGIALYRLNRQQQEIAKLRNSCTDRAAESLGVPAAEKKPPRGDYGNLECGTGFGSLGA